MYNVYTEGIKDEVDAVLGCEDLEEVTIRLLDLWKGCRNGRAAAYPFAVGGIAWNVWAGRGTVVAVDVHVMGWNMGVSNVDEAWNYFIAKVLGRRF